MLRFTSERQVLLVSFLLAAPRLFGQTPSISSWTPSHAAAGGVVSIAGKNFDASTSVYFNGVAGTGTKVQSQWSLQVTVPAGASTGPVKVVNAAGSYTASVNFTVDSGAGSPNPSPNPNAPLPTISSYSPSHGLPGTQITIGGTNLGTTTAVYFNGVQGAGLSVVNAYYVKVNVPTGAGSGPIKIVNQGGTYTTSTNFTVDAPPPTISSWNPAHAPVGSSVTISGANLTTTSKVTFNGVSAVPIKVNSDWSVTVNVPAGATTGPVTITNAGGSYTASVNFTVDGTGSSGSGGSSSGGSSGGGASGGGGSQSGFISPPPTDPPSGAMTGHPRIFVRQADLQRLHGWANANNPMWNDLLSVAQSAKAMWDGGQVPADSGNGSSGFTPVESFAELFAFMSLVHPDASAQADYAKRAHDIVMTIITQAAAGQAAGQPYRGPEFAIGNRASWFGEAFPLVLDWDYASFSAADKAAIRTVFLRWIQECLVATTTGGDHPQPVGVVNDPSLVATAHAVRWATNNYFSNHARHIGLMSMALDAADDIPANAAVDPPAGTLRRFVGNAIGAWLYAQSKYEATDGAGGIEPEGFSYGEDLTFRAWSFLLLAMQTTGTDNPQIYGAQAAAAQSTFWSQSVEDGFLHMLSPGQTVQQNWIGPAYLPYSFGDYGQYVVPDVVRTFGALAMYAINTGNTAQYTKLRWMIDNLMPGGLGARDNRIKGTYSSSGSWEPAIFYFLATDPYSAGVDPRPSEPHDYFAPGLGIVLSRTGWTQNDSWMTYKLSWNAIDHQHGDGNAIGLYRKGEWLTMPAAGYGVNIGSSDYQNTLAVYNPGVTNDSFWTPNMTRGSQWEYETNGDPPAPAHNSTATYTFVQGDATNLYNNPTISAMDAKHVSRSALWLKPDVMVIYDRATTGVAGHFKRFHLNTPALATVNGKSATVVTPGGQSLSVDALLPANATLTAAPRETFSDFAEQAAGDPMPFRLWSEDASLPADVRFLHVLQGGDSPAAKLPVSLVQSSSGVPFDGAIVGTAAILFRHDITTVFDTVTFSIPANATQTYVTGLTPGAGYTVVKIANGATAQYTVTAGGPAVADAGGVLTF